MLVGHRISTWPTSQAGPILLEGADPRSLLCPLILSTWLLISLALGIGTLLELGNMQLCWLLSPWPDFRRASGWLGLPVVGAEALLSSVLCA